MKKLIRELFVLVIIGAVSAGAFAQKGNDKRPPKEPERVPIPQAPANATTPETPTAHRQKKKPLIQEQRRFSGAEKLEYSCGLLSLSRARAPVSVRRFAVLLLSFGIPLAQTLIGASLLLVHAR
jgi:hypothetical protein